MFLVDFFYKYFVEPIQLGYGYNTVNTLVYALLFVFCTYLIFKFLKKMKIGIDRTFILSITPWIVFGILLRILEDMGLLSGYLFVTPNIWLLFVFVIISLLGTSKFVEKKYGIPYFKIMFITGIIFIAPILGMLAVKNLLGFGYVLLWFVPWVIIFSLVKWPVENKIVSLLHLFDATATFVSLQYFDYFEQHVLPRVIIESTGTPFSFVVVKLVVIVAVLKILDKYSDDKEFTNYLKIIIGILGLATGLRDLLRLVLLV